MCLFKKKKNQAERTKENSELISRNAKRIEELIVLAGDDKELIGELRSLQEKLRYLIPSGNDKVADYDRKIKGQIEDLKIKMVKGDAPEDMQKTMKRVIMQISQLIAERNAEL